MSELYEPQHALSDSAARQLANATKTAPQLSIISPRGRRSVNLGHRA